MPRLFPKFRPQLEKILESTGKPSPEDVESMKSPFAGTMLESIPPTRQVSLGEAFSGASAQALDLMLQCLHFNPDKRVRAPDALKHPYVAEFHNPDDEPDYPHGAIQVRTAAWLLVVNSIDPSTLLFQRTGVSIVSKGLDVALHLVCILVVIMRYMRVHCTGNVTHVSIHMPPPTHA